MRLVERKLGRERDRADKSKKFCFGQHHSDGLIEVDPRQPERERLDTLCHELIHHVTPEWDALGDKVMEEKTNEAAKLFSRILWRDGWRRIRL